MLKSKSRNFYL